MAPRVWVALLAGTTRVALLQAQACANKQDGLCMSGSDTDEMAALQMHAASTCEFGSTGCYAQVGVTTCPKGCTSPNGGQYTNGRLLCTAPGGSQIVWLGQGMPPGVPDCDAATAAQPSNEGAADSSGSGDAEGKYAAEWAKLKNMEAASDDDGATDSTDSTESSAATGACKYGSIGCKAAVGVSTCPEGCVSPGGGTNMDGRVFCAAPGGPETVWLQGDVVVPDCDADQTADSSSAAESAQPNTENAAESSGSESTAADDDEDATDYDNWGYGDSTDYNADGSSTKYAAEWAKLKKMEAASEDDGATDSTADSTETSAESPSASGACKYGSIGCKAAAGVSTCPEGCVSPGGGTNMDGRVFCAAPGGPETVWLQGNVVVPDCD